ncbi:hypothetical protein ACFVOK_23575 [Streptomyces sp. NPDC057798]|uniref:hypothetical protein n=1 Tax=Streptomyces sp. NPDC057798 TaxID=3346252 RepID=UPI003682C9BE
MPANLTEFADSTAFERYVLDRATPLVPTTENTSVIELGEGDSTSLKAGAQTAYVEVGTHDSTSGPVRGLLSVGDVRPLLFGAAWKVLDQLVELVFQLAGVSHDRGSQYTIGLKKREAQAGNLIPMQPFAGRSDLWTRAMMIYAVTEDLRNSLAHRQLRVDTTTGEMIATPPKPGVPPLRLTSDEQHAFCQAAAGVAEAVIQTDLPTRRADQLGWAMDQLVAHHGMTPFGVPRASGLIPKVIVRPTTGPSDELTLDFDNIDTRARRAVGGPTHYDLEIHLQDGRVLATPLEDAPKGGPVTFSIEAPPNWLHLV